jgi:P-type E1-E2 ATPase
MVHESRHLLEDQTLYQILNSVSVGIALIVLSAPEGLPMAISLVLAFQIKDKQSCITNLAAAEKMGTVRELIVSKSGIMTLNKNPTVTCFYIEKFLHENDIPNRFETLSLKKETRDIFL